MSHLFVAGEDFTGVVFNRMLHGSPLLFSAGFWLPLPLAGEEFPSVIFIGILVVSHLLALTCNH